MALSSSGQQTTFGPAQGAHWALFQPSLGTLFRFHSIQEPLASSDGSGVSVLAFDATVVEFCPMKAMSFREMKRRKAHRRMALARQASRSPRVAAAIQQRVSLVGRGAKWRITNLNEVARAIANWA